MEPVTDAVTTPVLGGQEPAAFLHGRQRSPSRPRSTTADRRATPSTHEDVGSLMPPSGMFTFRYVSTTKPAASIAARASREV